MKKRKGTGKKSRRTPSQRRSLRLGIALLVVLAIWGGCAEWFVHHPRAWLNRKFATLPKVVTVPLFWLGNPLADVTHSHPLHYYY